MMSRKINKEVEVSIIMPSFNTASFIERSIKSVKLQIFKNWELLIVDDLSTDNSISIIEKNISDDNRITLIKNKVNIGSGLSRNLALSKAKGRYIAFLDSDDIWCESKLEEHLKFIKENKAVLSYTSYKYIDESDIVINSTYRVRRKKTFYKDLLKKTDIGCLTAIYDSEVLGKIPMKNLRKKQDYALWLDILKKGYFALPYDKVLAHYRVRKNSVTGKKFLLIKNHYCFLRKIEKLNVLKSLYYTYYWGVNGFKKFFLSKLKFKL